MIKISQAKYDPKMDQCEEWGVCEFPHYSKVCELEFERLVSLGLPVYLWGEGVDCPVVIAESKAYREEWSKIGDWAVMDKNKEIEVMSILRQARAFMSRHQLCLGTDVYNRICHFLDDISGNRSRREEALRGLILILNNGKPLPEDEFQYIFNSFESI